MSLTRFDSLSSYLAVATSRPIFRFNNGHDWDFGVSPDEAVTRATHGDPKVTPSFIEGLDRLETDTEESPRRRWTPSVAGGRVSVPAYLAGHPHSMRRRTPREIAARHVAVYVDVAASAGTSAQDMLARGTAVLALLEYLTRTQVAVDLFLVLDVGGGWDSSESSDITHVIRIPSTPLDLATAGFAIAHPAFARGVMYGVAQREGFTGSWSSLRTRCGREGYAPKIRARLGLAPTDIYVPALTYEDRYDASWVEAQISQLRAAA